jgi:O-antigen ligase
MGYELPLTDYVEGSPLDRTVYTSLIAVAILILSTRKIRWGEVVQSNRWVCALFFYMLVSILWSNFPDVSSKRWIRSLGDAVMVLVVVTESDPLEAACSVLRRVMYIHFPLSMVFIKYFRHLGVSWDDFGVEMWTGITTHKNVLGQVVLIGGIYCLFEIIRKWRNKKAVGIYSVYLIMALWLLLASPVNKSNTSIALFILGVLLLFGLYSMKSKIAELNRYVVSCVVIVGIVLSGIAFFHEDVAQSVVTASVQASGRDMTLSGRTDMWSDLLTIASDNPILGVGYGSFWIGNTHNLWEKHLWRPTQGHNGYIDVYLELGVIGLILLGGVVLSAYKDILKVLATDFEQGALRFLWLILIVLHNVTESSFLRGTVDMWFVFLLATINRPSGFESRDSRKAKVNA